jgi:RNA polymerase sigma-54 factor
MEAIAMAMGPQLAMRPSRVLVASMQFLALPSAELERVVERELAENPALERAESRLGGADGLETVPDEPTPWGALGAELRLVVAARDRALAEYLLGCLDERGFLDAGVDVTRPRVREVLDTLRRLGPPGVAARDVRECLLLQIDRLPDTAGRELARAVVSGHLEELARGRYGALARQLGVTREDVLGAREWIRSRLRPYPVPLAPDTPVRRPPAIVPEIAVRAVDGGLAVDLLEPRRFGLRISASYERADAASLRPDQRASVGEQLARGRAFLDRLERRWATIRAVTELLVDFQRDFVLDGPRALKPLTRARAAELLGFHESTVSRAVAGRQVLLPSRRVIALGTFFDASAGPRDVLAGAVAAERRPLSDSELAAALARAGFPVARRTVAKYRDQLGIPAQALR